jgi:hypothetical protein
MGKNSFLGCPMAKWFQAKRHCPPLIFAVSKTLLNDDWSAKIDITEDFSFAHMEYFVDLWITSRFSSKWCFGGLHILDAHGGYQH